MSGHGVCMRNSTERIMRRAGLVLAAFLACVLLYASLIEPNWVAVTYHGEGPAGRSPIRIAVLSDLHLDGIGYRERVVIEQLREVRPDILVLAGDVVDEPDDLPSLRTLLSQLDLPQAVAVLGNWEYWGAVPLEQLHKLYRDHNVALLVNAGVQFPVEAAKFDCSALMTQRRGSRASISPFRTRRQLLQSSRFCSSIRPGSLRRNRPEQGYPTSVRLVFVRPHSRWPSHVVRLGVWPIAARQRAVRGRAIPDGGVSAVCVAGAWHISAAAPAFCAAGDCDI